VEARRHLGVVALLALATACHHTTAADPAPTEEDDDTSFVEDGTDANAAETDAQLVASSLVSSSATGSIGLASVDLSGADLGTQALGDGAKAIYLPRGCLAVTPAADTATYKFGGCLIGPNALGNIDGEVTAHYTASPLHLHLDLTATDLSVNSAKLDFSATADVTAASATDPERKLVWTAQMTGTTAGGREFTRTNSRTVTWTVGDACFSLSGTSEGQIRKRDIRTEISDFKRCRRGCPEAGGKITITNVAKNRSIQVLYDGTNHATYVGPNGRTVSIPLLCKP
jgi:hypothetical protein